MFQGNWMVWRCGQQVWGFRVYPVGCSGSLLFLFGMWTYGTPKGFLTGDRIRMVWQISVTRNSDTVVVITVGDGPVP